MDSERECSRKSFVSINIKSLSLNKQALYPSIGVCYAVPNVSKQGWDLMFMSERNADTGEYNGIPVMNLAHYNLYPMVIEYFQKNFEIDISMIGRKCLPRARVEKETKEHGWRVLHGDDMPTVLPHQILDEFGLRNVNPTFEYTLFEKMDPTDKTRLIEQAPFMKKLLGDSI